MSDEILTIDYQVNLKDMIKAGEVFMYSRIAIVLGIRCMQLMALMMLVAYSLLLKGGLPSSPQHTTIISLAIIFAFFHKRVSRKILNLRFKKDPTLNTEIHFEVNKYKIKWHGEKSKPGQCNWSDLYKVIKIKTGYILYSRSAKFLWLPIEGFKNTEQQQKFLELISEKGLKFRDRSN